MSIAMTLTAKGQFTFNKQLMEHINVRAGERVVIKKLPDNSLKIESEKNQRDIMDLAGSLRSKVRMTNDALQTAIKDSYIQAGLKGLQ